MAMAVVEELKSGIIETPTPKWWIISRKHTSERRHTDAKVIIILIK
jgi:hypothetical protein